MLNWQLFKSQAHSSKDNSVGFVAKAFSDGDRVLKFTFSTGDVDRDGDTIDQKGWNLPDSVPTLWAHDNKIPPIGKAFSFDRSSGNLKGLIEFVGKDISPFADSVYRLYEKGFLNSVSIGAVIKDFEFVNEKNRIGIHIKQQDLVEVSAVPVPSNPNAKLDQSFSDWERKGLADWADRYVQSGSEIFDVDLVKSFRDSVCDSSSVSFKLPDSKSFWTNKQICEEFDGSSSASVNWPSIVISNEGTGVVHVNPISSKSADLSFESPELLALKAENELLKSSNRGLRAALKLAKADSKNSPMRGDE